jgi:hypothetical protein
VGIVGSAVAAGLGRGTLSRNFADTTHVDWWLLSACGGFVFVLGLVSTSSWAARAAHRTAQKFELEDGLLRLPNSS